MIRFLLAVRSHTTHKVGVSGAQNLHQFVQLTLELHGYGGGVLFAAGRRTASTSSAEKATLGSLQRTAGRVVVLHCALKQCGRGRSSGQLLLRLGTPARTCRRRVCCGRC